jgi:hypothetical protein
MRRLILPLATAMLVAACLGEGRAEDFMTIRNMTDEPIVVTHEAITNGQVFAVPVIELDPGESSLVGGFGGERCRRGEFVARSGDQVVGRLPQPCKEQVWVVGGPASPSSD